MEPLTVVVSFDTGEQLTFGRLARGIGNMMDELRAGTPLFIGALSRQLDTLKNRWRWRLRLIHCLLRKEEVVMAGQAGFFNADEWLKVDTLR